MELDIVVKINDLNYSIIGLEKLNISKTHNKLFSFNVNRDNIVIFIQISENYLDKNYELSFYNIDSENVIDTNFKTYTIIELLDYLDNIYNNYNQTLFFQNTSKIFEYMYNNQNDYYNKILDLLSKKHKSYYCLDSILKTITKIPTIIQGRQVSRKYRIPQINQVYLSLKLTNIYQCENITYNYRYLFNIILQKLNSEIVNNTYLTNSQKNIFNLLINNNIHIRGNNYSGKTISIYYKIINLIYSGVDIENITIVVDKTKSKKIVENFWNTNLLTTIGYKINVIPIENMLKNTITNSYIFIDINIYKNIEILDKFYNKYNNINNKLIIIENEYLANKFKIENNYYINDYNKSILKIKNLDINSNINNIIFREDSLYIIDNQLDLEYKLHLRKIINKDNIVSTKKLDNNLLVGNEFYGIYVFIKENINEIILNTFKRAVTEIIIYK